MGYGKKAQALIDMDAKFPGRIPPLVAISDEEVKTFFTLVGIDIKALWDEVVALQDVGSKSLSEAAKAKLRDIREKIKGLGADPIDGMHFKGLLPWVKWLHFEGQKKYPLFDKIIELSK